MAPLSFLTNLGCGEQRNYVVLVDCGPLMQGPNKAVAEQAVIEMLPAICSASPSGVSLALFAESFLAVGHATSEHSAKELLKRLNSDLQPFSGSCLSEALAWALQNHFAAALRTSSILVITAGAFQDGAKVVSAIATAAESLGSSHELSISFLQIGYNDAGKVFLSALVNDANTSSRWPIADALALSEIHGEVGALPRLLQSANARTEWSDTETTLPNSTVAGASSPSLSRRSSIQSDVSEALPLASLAFYASLLRGEAKDYEVLLDCSQGMGMADYNMARHILGQTLGHVFDLDKDGISVWVMKGGETFGEQFITDGETLDAVFWQHVPQGAPRLSTGLEHALNEFFLNKVYPRPAMSILIVVSAPPVDWQTVANLLVKAALDGRSRDLTVSILHVGAGADWTKQLAAEVNVRAGRAFADAFQVPPTVARRASQVLEANHDTIRRYVERLLPPARLADAFAVKPSQHFFAHHPAANAAHWALHGAGPDPSWGDRRGSRSTSFTELRNSIIASL